MSRFEVLQRDQMSPRQREVADAIFVTAKDELSVHSVHARVMDESAFLVVGFRPPLLTREVRKGSDPSWLADCLLRLALCRDSDHVPGQAELLQAPDHPASRVDLGPAETVEG